MSAETSPAGEVDSSNEPGDKEFSCADCEKSYTKSDSLAAHYRSENNDCSGIECPTCGDAHFTTETGMKRHHGHKHDESLRQVEFTCDVCGVVDTKEPHHYNENGKNYCSHDCMGEDLERKQTVECEWCGAELVRDLNQYKRSERFFCGDKDCLGKWRSENRTGKNHPQYDPDSHLNYGPNWEQQSEKARERDGHECQICGVSQDEFPRALPVHHIKPRSEFIDESGYDYKQANRLDNLITLCYYCHGKYGDWVVLPLY